MLLQSPVKILPRSKPGMGEPARKVRSMERRRRTQTTTLLDLVAAVSEVAKTEAEVVATVQHLINSGRVRLVGHFRGPDVKVG
jgi:hypothetical protein